MQSFATWSASFGLSGAQLTADTDGDGLTDGLEYVLGTSPVEPTRGGAAQFRREGGDNVFRFTHPVWVTGVTYGVETSVDLKTWTPSAEPLVVESVVDLKETLMVKLPPSVQPQFVRLTATFP